MPADSFEYPYFLSDTHSDVFRSKGKLEKSDGETVKG